MKENNINKILKDDGVQQLDIDGFVNLNNVSLDLSLIHI